MSIIVISFKRFRFLFQNLIIFLIINDLVMLFLASIRSFESIRDKRISFYIPSYLIKKAFSTEILGYITNIEFLFIYKNKNLRFNMNFIQKTTKISKKLSSDTVLSPIFSFRSYKLQLKKKV